ncbi:MAG TPA: ACP S-malonyltransferase, partial [Ramlibacter sp.]|nr:ACP S-malonyltransferase [Ramlibacter sp.]
QEASDALGEDLARLINEGPKEALGMTTNTQPAMLVAGVAAWRAWLAEGGAEPAAVAGHSLGEYAALVASGVLTLPDAARLVRFRAQAMQEAVPVGTGAMAAILGMDAQKVIEGCAQAVRSFGANTAEIVEAVNFNDPAQTVIAGSKKAVEKACEVLKAGGAKRALPLPVSAPFHSSLMKPAAERLKERLAVTPFAMPHIPVINNIDVRVEADPDRIRSALFRQAFGPVRWVECVQAIRGRGIDTLVECGPGRVLAGLAKRIDPQLTGVALYDPATLAEVKGLLA